jgi:hypothetical protein
VWEFVRLVSGRSQTNSLTKTLHLDSLPYKVTLYFPSQLASMPVVPRPGLPFVEWMAQALGSLKAAPVQMSHVCLH